MAMNNTLFTHETSRRHDHDKTITTKHWRGVLLFSLISILIAFSQIHMQNNSRIKNSVSDISITKKTKKKDNEKKQTTTIRTERWSLV